MTLIFALLDYSFDSALINKTPLSYIKTIVDFLNTNGENCGFHHPESGLILGERGITLDDFPVRRNGLENLVVERDGHYFIPVYLPNSIPNTSEEEMLIGTLYMKKSENADKMAMSSIAKLIGIIVFGLKNQNFLLDKELDRIAEHDHYTGQHCKRVAEYAALHAEYLKMSEYDLELIRYGVNLHDIGKLGVPDNILNKPGPLNDEEWAVMQNHTIYGYDTLTAISLFDAAEMARYHHEKWDGTGYPDKLAGENIPYMARLVTISDVFDAITTDRPYHKAISIDQALEEINKMSETAFEPALAMSFIQMAKEKRAEIEEIMAKYPSPLTNFKT